MGRLKVLLIKMSSLGDVIHTLPAIEEAYRAKNIEVTWVVEPSFAEIASWHPAVSRVIPLPLRKIRKHPGKSLIDGSVKAALKEIRDTHYDLVLDAQGLIKSAVMTKIAKGPSYGLDKQSAREPLASWVYKHKIQVPKGRHAVERLRQLFSSVFDYPLTSQCHYGLEHKHFQGPKISQPSVLFLHGTTWATKHWPVSYWQQLAKMVSQAGFQVLLPWGNEHEFKRANQIICQPDVQGSVLDKMGLEALAKLISQMQGVVAVDTGLGHLAAALGVPCLSLYGPTNPELTRTYGQHQYHLISEFACAPCLKRECPIEKGRSIKPPCFESLTPQRVWANFSRMIASQRVGAA